MWLTSLNKWWIFFTHVAHSSENKIVDFLKNMAHSSCIWIKNGWFTLDMHWLPAVKQNVGFPFDIRLIVLNKMVISCKHVAHSSKTKEDIFFSETESLTALTSHGGSKNPKSGQVSQIQEKMVFYFTTHSLLKQILACTLQRQFRLYIPFLGIARPQPQFPHSCVFERFLYSQDQSTYFLQQKRQTLRGNI